MLFNSPITPKHKGEKPIKLQITAYFGYKDTIKICKVETHKIEEYRKRTQTKYICCGTTTVS